MSSRADTIFTLSQYRNSHLFISVMFTLLWALPGTAAMDPRFELDQKALGMHATPRAKTSSVKAVSRTPRSHKYKSPEIESARGTIHVIKPGDNLFKILMRDYGLSNDEAEIFIEEIRRENNIYDIRRLKIGQKITIPTVRRKRDGTIMGVPSMQSAKTAAISEGAGQSFVLESPVSPFSEQEATVKVRQVWDKLLPPLKDEQKSIMFQSPSFSLTLDPQRYPIFATMDSGKIVLDQNATIPSLVKTLIAEKDPSLRIISESPLNGKRFLSAILASAGFYSVEENFSMDFGADPKLTIHSDFKIEVTPESLIKQDIVLMNSGFAPLSPVIDSFLKKEGFRLYEPFASIQPAVPVIQRTLYQISTANQSDIIDALLTSVSVTPDKDRFIDVFAADNNGISLSVKAQRYFERNGKRHVVTSFDGDPVTYTLFRILETKGYQVLILEAQDDFRKISDKLLTRLKIQGQYAQHKLEQNVGANYSLQMSGYMLDGAGLPAGGLFVTNLVLDRVIRDLLIENGYSITSR